MLTDRSNHHDCSKGRRPGRDGVDCPSCLLEKAPVRPQKTGQSGDDGPALDRALEGRRYARLRTNARVAFVGFRLIVRVLRRVIATASSARADIVASVVAIAVTIANTVAVDRIVNRVASSGRQSNAKGHYQCLRPIPNQCFHQGPFCECARERVNISSRGYSSIWAMMRCESVQLLTSHTAPTGRRTQSQ
jgi:hypothetical protein